MISYNSIGIVETPFKEKFGVPRSAGLAPKIEGRIRIYPAYAHPEAIRGLASFSHLWLIFDFHLVKKSDWSPCVRPPRLGGNEKIGVYASRSPYRPNTIGLSCVAFSNPRFEQGELLIDIKGPDLVDGTPLLDIKPYSPTVDRIDCATEGWISDAPPIPCKQVQFSSEAIEFLIKLGDRGENLKDQISSYLQMDPRPSYKESQSDQKVYSNRFYEFDIKWKIDGAELLVLNIFLFS